METVEGRDTEEPGLKVARHGERFKEGAGVEGGAGFHEGGFMEGGGGRGGRRRQGIINMMGLSQLDGINQGINLGEQRVAHKGVAEPGRDSATQARAHQSLLRRTRPPSVTLHG